MKFIGDFHIHSHYSRATSKRLTPEYLNYWAQVKGIKVIGTVDFTHPSWLKEPLFYFNLIINKKPMWNYYSKE